MAESSQGAVAAAEAAWGSHAVDSTMMEIVTAGARFFHSLAADFRVKA
jgi:hypothetical protein